MDEKLKEIMLFLNFKYRTLNFWIYQIKLKWINNGTDNRYV